MGISRDEICAQRIGQIAEMGCMEEEIIVFGCCYLEDGKVKYRVSSDKDEIYQFLLKASDDKLFPTPVQELTVRQIIPTDGKDGVVYQVKRKLAQKLKTLYPAEYFAQMKQFVEQEAGNAAWPLLEQLREEMEGLFEADELHFYEMLVRQCCQKKLLDDKHKQQAWDWLEKNRNQMEDDIVIKEKNERTFYGILYLKADGTYGSKMNLELERVMQEKISLECDGVLVSPVLHKTFWYREAQELSTLRGKFTDWMKGLAGERLKDLLEQLQSFATPVDKAAYGKMLAQNGQLPQESQYAMQWYRSIWNVK